MTRAAPLAAAGLLALTSFGAVAGDTDGLSGPQLKRLYHSIETTYRTSGKFRTEYEPDDAPFDAETLTRNFAFVAQRSETQTIGADTLVEGAATPLVRWDDPINIWTLGATVEDKRHLDGLAQRVSNLTGLAVNRTRDVQLANVYILIADADERSGLSGLIATLGHSNNGPLGQVWPEQAKYPCIARVAIDPITHTMKWAIILIKDELNGAFRQSCLTEEFTQTLGLFNDGADIRPSIFNDDAEFIELTRHDEYLLQILYDRGLRPGMVRSTSEPIVREIATKLLADAKTF